ncbi:MAG: peptidoglycan bridge formation glycyltransferase FemA/FemB family protein [Bacilli bacterium]|nr:peptidoglycan bridge formation glycyltransferase FemA/FemB family protein [Bacilli bacterium]
MKIITLNPKQFDEYAKKHKYRNYFQSSQYANTIAKQGFKVHYLGILDEFNKLIGATLIIYKDMFMNKKIAYAPRGILFDYTNAQMVNELAKKLISVLGKQNFLILRMDPYIPATVRNKKGKIININNDVNTIMLNLKNAGFKYKGQNKFFENEKNRFEALVLLNNDIRTIYKSFSKRIRHKINRASKAGITIHKDIDKNIDELYSFIKNKTSMPKEYYINIVNNFNENCNIYYAILNSDAFVISAKERYENEIDKNNKLAEKIQNIKYKSIPKKLLNYKMESDKLINIYKNDLITATNILKEYPKGLIIGGAMTIDFDNASYLIVDGYNTKYKNLNCNYLIKWYIINESKTKGLKYFNMNAIVGEFQKKNPYSNLNDTKLEYNAIPTEYIGEFDLILNNFSYNIYKGLNKDKNYKLTYISKKNP